MDFAHAHACVLVHMHIHTQHGPHARTHREKERDSYRCYKTQLPFVQLATVIHIITEALKIRGENRKQTMHTIQVDERENVRSTCMLSTPLMYPMSKPNKKPENGSQNSQGVDKIDHAWSRRHHIFRRFGSDAMK